MLSQPASLKSGAFYGGVVRTPLALFILLFSVKALAFLSSPSSGPSISSTDQLAEGASNLYYTDARARASVLDIDLNSCYQDEFLFFISNVWGTETNGASAGISTTLFGTASAAGINSTENAAGVLSCSVGNTTTGRCGFFLNSATGTSLYLTGSWTVDVTMRVMPDALSDGTDTYALYVGIGDTSATGGSEPTNGVYFRYSSDANGGEYQGIVRAGGVTNDTIDTNTAGVATYNILRVSVSSAGSVAFYINGTQVGTSTASLPSSTTALRPFFKIIKSSGNTTRIGFVDYTKTCLSRGLAR